MRLTPLTANTFRSDGGAMFGLVPKALWEKRCPAHGDNTIDQRANVILVETDDGKMGLVDTGCGDPEWYGERERELHGLESEWLLPQSLAALGLDFADIDWIVLTHAHWDHAGALTDPDGTPVFPNAAVYLRETELDSVLGGDPLLYKSYPPKVVQSFQGLSERIFPAADNTPGKASGPAPGVTILPASGHTEGQACILFDAPRLAGSDAIPQLALFAGDNCPTQHHLRMVFQTAYDTFPLKTRAWKRSWLAKCAEEDILLLFSHDPELFGAWLHADPKHEFVISKPYAGGPVA